jgi:hypothetical protein
MHYYVNVLQMALRCLREIHLLHSGVIMTAELTVDDNGEIKLPANYIDYIKVGHKRGRYVVPMSQNVSYSRRPSIRTNDQVPFDSYGISGIYDPYNSSYISQYGEQLGRLYGLGTGTKTDVFKVIPERNAMLIGEHIPAGETVVVEYIGQTQYASAGAFIPAYAEETVETYISLQLAKLSGKRIGEVERLQRDYRNAERKMRAANYALTKEDLLNIERDNIKMSIKG